MTPVKKLLNAVPASKRFVLLNVLLKWLQLLCTVALIFCFVEIIRRRGSAVAFPLLSAAISIAAGAASAFFISMTSYKASSGVKKTLRPLLYEKLLRLGASYREKVETAKVVQLAVEGVEQLEVWFGLYLPQLFYSALSLVTVFAAIAFLNLKMAIILLICVPLIPLSLAIVQTIARRILAKYWTQYANLADNFLENLQGLSTLQIYQADEFKQRQMDRDAERFRTVTMKVLSMQLNSIIVMDVVAYGGAGLGIAVALSAYASGAMSMENCFACILLSADFFIPLRRLGSFFHTAMNGTTACKNIFNLLDVEEPTRGSVKISADGNAIGLSAPRAANFIEGVEFKNVFYAYGARRVLQKISLFIPKGSFVAFTGKSGSGKTTAAKIIAGINKNYEGCVLLNGVELRDIEDDSLHAFCMYISHRDWIFKGTVRDTLLEGKGAANDGELWAALDAVKLSDFVRERQGLDTPIEEDAANLSGGQKQRLSIARALLRSPSMLIFDEATSNIDVESEKAILDLLRALKGTKTILMISHRAENCAAADTIYRFDEGIITEIAKGENAE